MRLLPNSLPGYSFCNFPRPSHAGGVAIIHKSEINVKTVCIRQFESIEWAEVLISNSLKVILVYRPPPSKTNRLNSAGFLRDFSELLNMLAIEATPYVIMGDINVKVNRKDDPEAVKYLELLTAHGLCQLINEPTHRSGNTLDHIICQSSGNLQLKFTVDSVNKISDHFLVLFELPGVCVVNAAAKKPVLKRTARKFKNINIASFALDIKHELQLQGLPSGVDNAVSMYSSIMSSLVNKHAPETIVRMKGTDNKSWYNNDIHAARKVRRKFEHLFRKSGLEVHRQMLIDQNKAVVSLINKTKSAFFSTQTSQL
jgi:hypothetical protein